MSRLDPSDQGRTRLPGVRMLAAVLVTALALSPGCKCKKESDTEGDAGPPAQGRASSKELTTNIGSARGLSGIAASSTEWDHVFPIDDQRLVIAGSSSQKAVALMTLDGGSTWSSLETDNKKWASWSFGVDGALLLATGTYAPTQGNPKKSPPPPVDAAFLHFTGAGSERIGAPSPLLDLPDAGAPPPGLVAGKPLLLPPGPAVGAVVSKKSAVFIGEQTPRVPLFVFGAPLGAPPPAPIKVPPGEKPVRAPYGRPPMFLSVRGGSLLARPYPEPGQPLATPKPIDGITITPTLVEELSHAPDCETETWSFKVVSQPSNRFAVLGVGPDRIVAINLPTDTPADTAVGCGFDKVVVEGEVVDPTDPNVGRRRLTTCDLTGQCVPGETFPFRKWDEEHERRVEIVATKTGAVAAMMIKSASRWGLFISQTDDGKAWEIQRPVGEGQGDRDRFELGALARVGDRVVLLLDASMTGRSSRSWFVLVSDDGGLTWDSP